MRSRLIWPVCIWSNVVRTAARQPDDDAGEDEQRHAVADAALGDLLAEPHDEHRAGRERQDAHQPEAPARVVDQRQPAGDLRLALEPDGDAQRLHDGEHQRQVARVLRDLAPPELAFLRDPLEVGQTTVSSCRMIDELMYGMTPSAKIVTRDRWPPENMLYRPNIVFASCSARIASASGFTPGRRDVAADAVHAEQREREEHAVAQVGDREQILERVIHIALTNQPAVALAEAPCFVSLLSASPSLPHFRRAAGRRDLLRRLAAELVRAHRQLLRDVAARQHLDRLPAAVNQPRLDAAAPA